MECKTNRLIQTAKWLQGSSSIMTLVSGPQGLYQNSKPRDGSRNQPGPLAVGKPSHVGVIGAGLAGLRCAAVLLQKGIRVTILEARDRVGGRVSISISFTVPCINCCILFLTDCQICQSDIAGIPVDL